MTATDRELPWWLIASPWILLLCTAAGTTWLYQLIVR
jgi:hypothetical protein